MFPSEMVTTRLLRLPFMNSANPWYKPSAFEVSTTVLQELYMRSLR